MLKRTVQTARALIPECQQSGAGCWNRQMSCTNRCHSHGLHDPCLVRKQLFKAPFYSGAQRGAAGAARWRAGRAPGGCHTDSSVLQPCRGPPQHCPAPVRCHQGPPAGHTQTSASASPAELAAHCRRKKRQLQLSLPEECRYCGKALPYSMMHVPRLLSVMWQIAVIEAVVHVARLVPIRQPLCQQSHLHQCLHLSQSLKLRGLLPCRCLIWWALGLSRP